MLVDFDKVDLLEKDKKFILIKTETLTLLKKQKLKSYEEKESFFAKSNDLYDLNNLAIYQIRQAKADEAEANLKKIIKTKPAHFVSTINLVRLYYLVGDFELVRKAFGQYLTDTKAEQKKVFSMISYLEKKNRIDEKVLFLDVVVGYEHLEIKALEQLGLYFLQNRDFQNAKSYFEKLLQIDSFNTVALTSMMQISFENEEWDAVILYGITLDKLQHQKGDYFYYMAKSYYETKEFGKAIQFSELAAKKSKVDFHLLTVWRDSIVCNDISAPIGHLKKYFSDDEKEGRDVDKKEFFLLDSKMGRNVFYNVIHGR